MQTQNYKLNFAGQNIYVGFDSHKKDWTVTIMHENIMCKTFTQPPNPKLLSSYLKKNYPGANYFSAYEASFCGFWIHKELIELGIKNIVVNPADIPTSDKERKQKEDRRDISTLSAMILLTEIDKIDRFSNFDSFCSFVGLIPSTASTGEKEITRGITPRRSRMLRSIITQLET